MFKGLFKKIDQLITGRGGVDDDLYDELKIAHPIGRRHPYDHAHRGGARDKGDAPQPPLDAEEVRGRTCARS